MDTMKVLKMAISTIQVVGGITMVYKIVRG